MSVSINIIANEANDGYTASEYVEALTNVPGQLTPVIEFSPERGLYRKIRNRVSKGDKPGVPIYARWRDANGDLLPTSTEFVLAIEPLGESQMLHVSDEIDNISYWNQNDIGTQQNDDNVDSVKVPLKYPPGHDGDGRPDAVNVNGTDRGYLLMNSPAEISWEHSEFHVDSEALEQGRNSQ